MNYQNNYEDECFVATTFEEYQVVELTEEQHFLNQQIRNSIPQANQLKPYYRPTKLAARVMSTEPDLTRLPSTLDLPCEENLLDLQPSAVSTRPKINNKEKLTLAEYLDRREFYIFYSKNGTTLTSNINEMTMRLRPISQVSDFNEKAFKEISDYQPKKQMSEQSIDSNFECGNLARAYINQNNQNAYYLLLEQDTNTHGYTNWFFFRFRNKQVGLKKFYILNMVKRTSFYKQGMKISIFSIKKWQDKDIKWFKGGSGISFFQTNFGREEHTDCFNCLYFEYDFEYQNDEVYFAATQPYTYTRLSQLLKPISQLQPQSPQLQPPSVPPSQPWSTPKFQILGYSVSNNIIPSITFSQASSAQKPLKKSIVILGRQHPCQMAGSFICEYLIKMLMMPEGNQEIAFLLSKFNIVVIPMVNPDGVIYGNSRSNLCGLDLNRHWGPDAIKQLTPQTNKIRSSLCHLQKNSQHIKFLLDLHGHGKKLNSFLFCCRKQDRISNRYFPLIMSKLQDRFDIASCTYGIARDKENTVRAQLFDIGIRDCYTLENSYFGYNCNKQVQEVIPYKESDYHAIAKNIIKSLYIFFSTDKTDKEVVRQKIGWNMDTVNEELIKIVDRLEREEKNYVNDEDIMSESDPEGDGLKLEERLKLCTNSKVLGRKIRESFKKSKSVEKSSKISKRVCVESKVKTQPVEEDNEVEGEDTRAIEKKIEGKLILNKKLRTHQKIKTSLKKRRNILQQKQPKQIKQITQQIKQITQQYQQKTKKQIQKQFNPLKIPPQLHLQVQVQKQQSSRLSTSLYSKNFSHSQTKGYQKCRIYQKLKTQITETHHAFSEIEIQTQNTRKFQIQSQLCKLKEENLKNVVKQSLLFLGTSGTSIKNKKCKWVDDRKQKTLTSNHLIQAKLHSFSVNLDNYEDISLSLKSQKSQAAIAKTQKIQVRPPSNSIQMKVYRQSSKQRPKRSYQRFQNFVKNTPRFTKLLGDNKGPVFYHFPVM